MVEFVLIKQPVIYPLLELEGAGCALRQAKDVVGAQRDANSNLIALDELVVSVHVRVVRGVQSSVSEVVSIIDHGSHDFVDVLHDAEWAE
jgi:hypothetical protein